ncbi:MAG: type II toxin-antitoxin system RelE/ParE family toxin [Bacteroidales bacterium]
MYNGSGNTILGRSFYCFLQSTRIVLINCFVKKSPKRPKNEIELGEKLRREYFDFKERSK